MNDCCVFQGSTIVTLCDNTQLKVGNEILVPNVTSTEFKFQISREKFVQWSWQKTAFGFQMKSKNEADSMFQTLKQTQDGTLKRFDPIFNEFELVYERIVLFGRIFGSMFCRTIR